jgi:hypothetical protein
MQHVLDAEKSKVIRYELPAMNALNFMLENALGGGGLQVYALIRKVRLLHSNY